LFTDAAAPSRSTRAGMPRKTSPAGAESSGSAPTLWISACSAGALGHHLPPPAPLRGNARPAAGREVMGEEPDAI